MSQYQPPCLIEAMGFYYQLPEPNEELDPEFDYWPTEEVGFETEFEGEA